MVFYLIIPMSDEIVIINFLTTIENNQSIPVPESNQEYMAAFVGEKVLVTVRKRNLKNRMIEDEKSEDNNQ
ncbi:MAG TPA: hypothetical protein VIZ62_11975 [Nitrososphaeraceae archaeon]